MAGTIVEKVDAMNLDEPKDGQAGADATGTKATSADSRTDPGAAGDESARDGKADAPRRSEDTGKSDSAASGAADAGADGGGDTGYEADTEDESVKGEDDKPAAEAKPTPSDLSPDLQYVVDNLPTLTVRGKQADGSAKVFQVKAAGQLPEDFEFVTKREELLFNQALAGQELKAQSLQQEFHTNQQTKAAQEFSEKENADIRRSIGEFQREGKIERFKYQPDDPKFNDDAGVKQAQEVIDHMNKLNENYLQEYNKNGGVLYHVDFKTAYQMLASTRSADTKETPQHKEDQQRRQVTRQLAGATGAPSNGTSKPRKHTSMSELINSLDVRGLN